jgi:hypothetical protein
LQVADRRAEVAQWIRQTVQAVADRASDQNMSMPVL